MFDFLKAKLRRTPVREDAWLRRDRNGEPVRNAQFVSFLQQSGFRKRKLDRHQRTVRIKKLVALSVVWMFVLAATWVAWESAEALELF